MRFFKSKEERAAQEAEIERQDREYAAQLEGTARLTLDHPKTCGVATCRNAPDLWSKQQDLSVLDGGTGARGAEPTRARPA
jgi:hypothetical protein